MALLRDPDEKHDERNHCDERMKQNHRRGEAQATQVKREQCKSTERRYYEQDQRCDQQISSPSTHHRDNQYGQSRRREKTVTDRQSHWKPFLTKVQCRQCNSAESRDRKSTAAMVNIDVLLACQDGVAGGTPVWEKPS